MNLFALERNPVSGRVDWIASARAHDNLRVAKMALEGCQILCTVAREYGFEAPYRATHRRHPVVRWAAAARGNYEAVLTLTAALFVEWADRFERRPEDHRSWPVFLACRRLLECGGLAEAFPRVRSTPPPQTMPEDYHDPDPVRAYRRYWVSKPRMRYPRGRVPEWFRRMRRLPYEVVG